MDPNSSGALNIGKTLFPGAQKGNGFDMKPQATQAETAVINRQNAIASGQTPGYSQLQLDQALQQAQAQAGSIAASARGINPALAQRIASQSQQEMAMQAGQQAAINAQQEKEQADQVLAAIAASQRGVAFDQQRANQQSETAYRGQIMDFVGNIGSGAMKASSGGAKP